jgi:hypothetical protein
MQKLVYSGQMNAQVEFFEINTTNNAAGEPQETRVSIGKRRVKRIDAVGAQEEDGAVLSLAVCRYQMRYESVFALKASQLQIDDFDGTWEVVGPMRLLEGGRRYMELRCRKRGES